MTGTSNETVDGGGTNTNNAGNTTALARLSLPSSSTASSLASTSFGSTTSTAMAGNNTSSLSRKDRVSIPKRSLLDDDDDDGDDDEEDDDGDGEQEFYNAESTTTTSTTNHPLVLTATEHNNERPPLHFKPRFSLAAHDDDDDENTRTRTNTQQGSNRRRHTLSTATLGTSTATANTNNNNNINNNKHYAWDDFVRQGTRLKTFLDDAMQHVKTNTTKLVGSKRQRADANDNGSNNDNGNNNSDGDDDDDNDDGSPRPLRRRRVEENDYTAELAREKTEQVMLLQRKLKEAEAHAAALQASTESLREEASSSQNRLERTVAALRIAGSNAAKARADADTAEATASSLSQSLQSLESVVTETKRACLVLQQEQTAVSSSATTIQATLLHKEADLARARKEVTVMRGQLRTLEASAARWQQDRKTLVQTSQHQQQELKRLEHAQTERDAMERARKERSDKVEHEWRQAQSMLVEATGGQAQAEQTQALLKETILELQCANKNLHENSWQQQESSRKEKDRLHDALTKAEKEAQQLRIQEEASGEDMQRLRLDKMAAEKQVSQLKIRVTGLERRLKDVAATSGGLVSPDALNNNTNDAISGIYVGLGTPNDASSSAGSSSIGGFSLPPLSGSSRLSLGGGGQENSKNVTAPAKSCSVCFKAAFGLMKSCQCGQSGCDKRAHITCASRINPGPSVSHPGTPAPRLPLVLCTAVSAAGARAAGALKSN